MQGWRFNALSNSCLNAALIFELTRSPSMGSDNVAVQVYAFGDQTYNAADVLSKLLRKHDDAIVEDFLERSASTLKHQIKQLPSEQQGACPRFASLADLLPSYRAGTLNPALVQALTCTTQLAAFLQ